MLLIADTHVHLYPKYDLERSFEAAVRNMEIVGLAQAVPPDQVLKCLCLTERSTDTFFSKLKSESLAVPNWTITSVAPGCLEATRADNEEIFIFEGFQIVTAEGLEVLALLCSIRPGDGQSLLQTIKAVKEAGGLVILPWSPGKWWFKRGRTLGQALAANGNEVCLGDILLNFKSFSEPAYLKQGREQGRRILSGSDPLPWRGEEESLGRNVTCVNFEGGLADFRADPINHLRGLLCQGQINSQRLELSISQNLYRLIRSQF